jgi:pimeloyl-ACP methyl ester carboxylesterase
VVQIAHGLIEHAGRYARLAEALTRAGYAVYAGDHRGYGRTAPTLEDLGFFAERDGWRKCVDDLWGLNQRIATNHPGLPIVLISHSMGSFMAQHFITDARPRQQRPNRWFEGRGQQRLVCGATFGDGEHLQDLRGKLQGSVAPERDCERGPGNCEQCIELL